MIDHIFERANERPTVLGYSIEAWDFMSSPRCVCMVDVVRSYYLVLYLICS